MDRYHQAIWNWTHTLSGSQQDPPTAELSRVAVDETQIEVDGEEKEWYGAIDMESKLLLEVDVDSRRGRDPAAAFPRRVTEKHDVSETEFLVDGSGYLTVSLRHELSGHLNYSERNHIEKWYKLSQYGSTASMPSGGAVQPVLVTGRDVSDTTITVIS